MGRHDNQPWKQTLYDAIGRNVNKMRTEKNLTLRGVAFKLGYSYQAVTRIEEGLGAPVHFLVAFAQLAGCALTDLVPNPPCTFNREIAPSDDG